MTNIVPENFQKIIMDMTDDLQNTFPEYSVLWDKWTSANKDANANEMQYLFDYCLTVYPERFFDILYQNESIFDISGNTNTFFLPSVDFKLLYNCENVSETTKKILWKYLQLILFTIIGSVKNKSYFGDTMNIFDGIDENDLHEKLSETMKNIGDFFENMSAPEDATATAEEDATDATDATNATDTTEEEGENEPEEKETFNFEKNTDIPNVNDLHEHIKKLFDGKIGSLAKELAEEISTDLTGILGDTGENIKSTKDVLHKLMQNPSKITELIKTVNTKLNDKLKSGEISQEELMSEAGDIIKKMQSMAGGNENIQEMFKNLAKMGGMPGMGGKTKVDLNALNRMTKQQALKEKLKNKMLKKKEEEAKKILANLENASLQQQQQSTQQQCEIKPTNIPNNFVFKLKDTEDQSVSQINNEFVNIEEPNDNDKNVKKSSKKKKNNKKK